MYEIIDLDKEQAEEIDLKLEEYDRKHIRYKLDGSINIGVFDEGKLVAGACGCM
jgi:hypothetical protein